MGVQSSRTTGTKTKKLFFTHAMRRGFFGGRGRRGGRRPNPFFVLMAMRLLDQIRRLPVKPPITLGLMGLMSVLHYVPELLFHPGARIGDLAMLPAAICPPYYELQRIVTGQLVHASDMHLYYNMASFLWKGVKMETSTEGGSAEYAAVVATLFGLTGFRGCIRKFFGSAEGGYHCPLIWPYRVQTADQDSHDREDHDACEKRDNVGHDFLQGLS